MNTDLKVYVKVKKDEYVYPLEKDGSLVLDGLLGPVVLNIEGGEAWIEESSCPDKLCMKMGRIDESGEWLACLPNKIFIRISGDDE